jgi:large conductance mechanosensitive channel
MSMMKEFREFAVKGNVIDLAVGVIIGAAFSKIVDSLVKDIIMPVVAVVTGGIDFSNKFVVLGAMPPGVARNLADLTKAGVPVFAWGNFLTVALNFLILAFIIFLMVQRINNLRRRNAVEPEAAAPAVAEDVLLLREIRDTLRR